MEKIDVYQLLPTRLGAIHELWIEMLQVFLAWITDGSAKRFALEHESEQVMSSYMEPFYQLAVMVQHFGEAFAWLENPHLEPLSALEEIYLFEGRDDNPAVAGPFLPDTGIGFLDLLLYLVIMMNQLDSFAEKLTSDSEKGRFKDTAAYNGTDLSLFNTELLVRTADIKEQFDHVRNIMLPGSETELPTDMVDFVQNHLKIQKDELARLLPLVPDKSEIGKLDDKREQESLASWYGAQAETS